MRDHDRAIGAMFDRIAPRYDRLNRLLSFGADLGWRHRALARARERHASRALDVGAGTGDLAIALARGSAELTVAALDLSSAMLRILGERARRDGVRARTLPLLGSATALPIADGAVDLVVAGFTLRNVGDVARGLREMRRVLRPGGRAVVLELSTPPSRVFRAAFRLYFDRLAPRLAARMGGDPQAYQYLPASVARFPGAEELASLFRGAGFRAVEFERLTLGIAAIHVGEA